MDFMDAADFSDFLNNDDLVGNDFTLFENNDFSVNKINTAHNTAAITASPLIVTSESPLPADTVIGAYNMADHHNDLFGGTLFSEVHSGLSAFTCDDLLAAEKDD